MKFQLAEVFHSTQGEGAYKGKPMFFVRFAGCSVGKYLNTPEQPATCTAWSGGTFLCDTDYRKHFTLTEDQIVNACHYDTICFTGGEPCDRDLITLINRAKQNKIRLHMETSGTKHPPWAGLIDWIVVSPKQGVVDEMLELCHELRFTYDRTWGSIDELEAGMLDIERRMHVIGNRARVYVSPICGYDTIDWENVDAVKGLVDRHPRWSLSVQEHKLLHVR
jgi:7-carboxy-7-deazaguanine synthase